MVRQVSCSYNQALTSFKFLSFGIAALATLALSSPLELVERNSSPVTVSITTDGACANSNPFVFNGKISMLAMSKKYRADKTQAKSHPGNANPSAAPTTAPSSKQAVSNACLSSGQTAGARGRLPLGMRRRIVIGKRFCPVSLEEEVKMADGRCSHCIPIANNGGSFKLTAGVSSVIVNCAEDQVP